MVGWPKIGEWVLMSGPRLDVKAMFLGIVQLPGAGKDVVLRFGREEFDVHQMPRVKAMEPWGDQPVRLLTQDAFQAARVA